MIALLENGKRRFGDKSLKALSNALGVSPDFLEGKTSFGIYCDVINGNGIVPLSFGEYQSQKRLGNIKEEIRHRKPLTANEEQELKNSCLKDYPSIMEERSRPYLERTIDYPPCGFKRDSTALKEEATGLIQGMNEEQLEKALLLIREVILK